MASQPPSGLRTHPRRARHRDGTRTETRSRQDRPARCSPPPLPRPGAATGRASAPPRDPAPAPKRTPNARRPPRPRPRRRRRAADADRSAAGRLQLSPSGPWPRVRRRGVELCRVPCSYTWVDVGVDGTGPGRSVSARACDSRCRMRARRTSGSRSGTRRAAARRHASRRVPPCRRPRPRHADADAHLHAHAYPQPPTPTPTPTPGCTLAGTTAASPRASRPLESAGQMICLASGDYGTFSGAPSPARGHGFARGCFGEHEGGASRAPPTSCSDGLTMNGASLSGSTHHITIRNSDFTSHTTISGPRELQRRLRPRHLPEHDLAKQWRASTSATQRRPTGSRTRCSPADSDGVQSGVGLDIINNEFRDILEDGPNHDRIPVAGRSRLGHPRQLASNNSSGIVAYEGTRR